MASLMLVSYPFLIPAAAGTLNLFFVIICTLLGFRKWGLLASGYTIFITWIMDFHFWHIGFGLDTYIFGTIINLCVSLVFGTILEKKNRSVMTDGLTGLLNHEHLHEFLAWEIRKSERFARELTFLMVDLDDFKQFNDRFGHQFGDEVLKKFSDLLSRCVRQADLVARYGGDEFAIIMPETSAQVALPVAQRIMEELKKMPLSWGDTEVELTLSVGGSQMTRGKSKEALIRDADRALYRAKQEGKNAVLIEIRGRFVRLMEKKE